MDHRNPLRGAPWRSRLSQRPQDPSRAQSGVSLIEALLALVVMALGMLGVVGVQATLRANGDLSRQRAEAVRLAQESIEEWRSFSALEAVAGALDYTDLVSDGPTNLNPADANTTYVRTRAVGVTASPPMRTVTVMVEWADRSGVNLNANLTNQRVLLHTAVAGVAPEVSVSLSMPAQDGLAQQPLGRHGAIPPSAVMQTNGTSKFVPPGQPVGQTTTIVFNNLSGRITALCTNPVNNATCSLVKAQFLSGYVRFAVAPFVSGDPATLAPALAADPLSTYTDMLAVAPGMLGLTAQVNYSTSSGAAAYTESCFLGTTSISATAPLEYFCVLPLYETAIVTDPVWSGRLAFGPVPVLVTNVPSELSSSRIRVCRYFDLRLPGGGYVNVSKPLALQNHVLIQAGNGSASYGCPAGTTVQHQPV